MYCKKCNKDLPVSCFDKWKTGSNKYQPYCRECNRVRIKEHMRLKRGLINAAGPLLESCEGCGANVKLSMDHNHKSGKFRGWLCTRCNLALGTLQDNPETLHKLFKYLQKSIDESD